MKIDDFLDGATGPEESAEEQPAQETNLEPETGNQLELSEPEGGNQLDAEEQAPQEKASAADPDSSLTSQVHQVLDKFEATVRNDDLREIAGVYAELQDVSHRLSMEQISLQKDIVDKLKNANETFISQLKNLSVTTDQRIAEIYGLINKGKAMVDKGSLKLARQIYGDIKAMYDRLPEELNEKKVRTQQAVLSYFLYLKNRISIDAINNFKQISAEIMQHIEQGKGTLRQGGLNDAKKQYDQASILYKKLPEGFLEHKASLYREILKLYNEINLSTEIAYLTRELQSVKKNDPVNVPIPKVQLVQKVGQPAAQQSQKKVLQVPEPSSLTEPPAMPRRQEEKKPIEPYTFKQPEKRDAKDVRQSLARAKLLRAQYEMRDNQMDRAREDIANALKLDPGNMQAKELLTKLHPKHVKTNGTEADR